MDAPDETKDRLVGRTTLEPNESAAGGDEANTQKEAILADSAERSEDLEAAPGSFVEHRTSDEATEPST